jgi:hypothetical protein
MDPSELLETLFCCSNYEKVIRNKVDPHVPQCNFYDGGNKTKGCFQTFYNADSFEIVFALSVSAQHSHVIAFMLKRAVVFPG